MINILPFLPACQDVVDKIELKHNNGFNIVIKQLDLKLIIEIINQLDEQPIYNLAIIDDFEKH